MNLYYECVSLTGLLAMLAVILITASGAFANKEYLFIENMNKCVLYQTLGIKYM